MPDVDPKPETYLSAAECAKLLGVTSARVRCFINKGRLRARIRNFAYQVAKSDLDAFRSLERKPGRRKGS